MPNYKMTISYDGTKYYGWQKQGNTRNTVQGLLEFVLEKILDQKVEVMGSGRTDAGVHAKGQVANFHLDKSLDVDKFLIKLNKSLPKDVAVLDFQLVDDRFHSRLNAKKKTYEYRIWNSDISNVFEGRYIFQSGAYADIKKMKEAGEIFLGTHDFMGFCSNKRYKKSTLRTIYSVDISKIGNEIKISICGNGFLYNMVRIMAGTILQVGEGKIAPQDINEMFELKDRQNSGITLPANGLTLISVEY